MARIRTIKPDFWEDEKIGKLPIPCRLFFIGCWNFADDFGCIKGSASLLKSQIFPYDENLRVSEVKKWIDALVDARMLIPIIHEEESYYYIRTFRSHQILDSRYSKSYIGKEIINDLINNALNIHDVITTSTHSQHDVITTEEKEKEKEKENKEILSNESIKKEYAIKEIFDIFRKKYPGTKKGLNEEFENFKKKHKDYRNEVFNLLPALEELLTWRNEKKKRGQFIPEYAHLHTWLNQRRWECELEIIENNESKNGNPEFRIHPALSD